MSDIKGVIVTKFLIKNTMTNLKKIILDQYNLRFQDSHLVVESTQYIELLCFNMKNMFDRVNNRTKITKLIKNPVIQKTIIKYCVQFGVNHRKFDNRFLIEILHDFLICLAHYFNDEDDFDDDDLDDDDFKKPSSRFDESDFLRFFKDIDKLMKYEGHDVHETNVGFILFKYLYYTVTRHKWPYDLNLNKKISNFFDLFDKF